MTPRTLFACLLAALGVTALPATAGARATAQAPAAQDQTDSADATDPSACDTTDSADATDPAGDSADAADPSADGQDLPAETRGAGDAADENSADPSAGAGDGCYEDLGDGVELDDATESDVEGAADSGSFTETFRMPGAGTIDEQLDPSAGARAARATRRGRSRSLAVGHLVVRRAGTVTVRVRLTPRGRRALRRGTSPLKVTLRRTVRLRSGTVVRTSKTFVVRPRPRRRA